MNHPAHHCGPKAIADYLWHCFEIQPGYALCVALGQPKAINNYDALLAWVRNRVEHHEADAEGDLIGAIEADLLKQMQAAGLVDGDVETRAAPMALLEPIGRTVRSARLARRSNPACERQAASGKSSNVIDLNGRSRR